MTSHSSTDTRERAMRVVRSDLGYTKGSPMSSDTSLDGTIRHCLIHGINVAEKLIAGYPEVVRVGNIAFHASPHDTGCSVYGWIIDGDEAYEFISTTYWYSSQYTFNRSKWERGAWDDAVTAAIGELRAKVTANRQHIEDTKLTNEQRTQRDHAATKARFAAQFTKAQS